MRTIEGLIETAEKRPGTKCIVVQLHELEAMRDAMKSSSPTVSLPDTVVQSMFARLVSLETQVSDITRSLEEACRELKGIPEFVYDGAGG